MLERPLVPSRRNSLLIMAAMLLTMHLMIWSSMGFVDSGDIEAIVETDREEEAGLVEAAAIVDTNVGEEIDTAAIHDELGSDAVDSIVRDEQIDAVTETETVDQYRVASGDTLYWIAQAFDTTVQELQRLNGLSGSTIRVGQLLEVPTESVKQYPAGVSLTTGEVRWLAQMIHAEARGEPYLGQVAVGAVILNRIKSTQFPNTMQGVLFQPRAFQPIANGSFYRPANDMAYRAALEALNGHDPSKGSLFFFNPRQSGDRFMHARPAMVTIGQHRFMR